jgi:hypothetical protein
MSTAPTQINALMPDTAASVLLGTSDPYETARLEVVGGGALTVGGHVVVVVV